VDTRLKNGLILAGIGYIGYELHQLSRFSKSYTLIPEGLPKFSISKEGIRIESKIKFRNNSEIDVPLKSISGELLLGGKPVGAFRLDKENILKAQSETSLPIVAYITGRDIYSVVSSGINRQMNFALRYRVVVTPVIAFIIPVPIGVTAIEPVNFTEISSLLTAIKELFAKK
jgi:hypothetical protein